MSSAEKSILSAEDDVKEMTENDSDVQEVSPSEEDAVDAMSPTSKTKYATVDIYRPPGVRSGDGSASSPRSKLNVHAKEFVFVAEQTKGDTDKKSPSEEDTSPMDPKPFESYPVNTSKSSISAYNDIKLITSQYQSNVCQKNFYHLQKVKSSGDVGLSLSNQQAPSDETDQAVLNSLRVKSSPSIPWEKLRKGALVSAAIAQDQDATKTLKTEKTSPFATPVLEPLVDSNAARVSPSIIEDTTSSPKMAKTSPPKMPVLVDRSKSLSTEDAFKFVQSETLPPKAFTEYDLFPANIQKLIQRTIECTSEMEDQGKIALARKVVEEAIDNGKLVPVTAKLSVIIMNKDKAGAYCDSLMNSCQMLYEKKTTGSISEPKKLVAFLNFLQELYTEVKRYKVQFGWSQLCESITLTLIASCCVDIVKNSSAYSAGEIECLFLVLTKVGRDIEKVAPPMFKRMFDTLREVLVAGVRGSEIRPEIRKVFLQLLELRAFEWQLPLSALNFYYPKILT